jgi:hypothetical protein
MLDKYTRRLQNIGSVLILAAYILLICKLPYAAWIGCLFFAGVIELILMFACNTTITLYIRSPVDKRIDTVSMLSSIVLTWWLAGPLAAGFFFLGFLVNHFGEKQ